MYVLLKNPFEYFMQYFTFPVLHTHLLSSAPLLALGGRAQTQAAGTINHVIKSAFMTPPSVSVIIIIMIVLVCTYVLLKRNVNAGPVCVRVCVLLLVPWCLCL